MININSLREKVERQRDTIIQRIRRLKRDDPFSSTDRSLIVEPGTDAAALFGHEQVVVLENRLKTELKEIEMALKKVKNGTYGMCERCGNKIDLARLEVKPSAIYCLKDEREMEKKRK